MTVNSKNIILLIITILALDLSAQDEITPTIKLEGKWKMDFNFSDEFNGKKLNSKQWWDFNPSWHGRKPSHFSRSNVKVKRGYLQLTAKSLNPKNVSVQDKARGYDKFSTAIVKSKNRSH